MDHAYETGQHLVATLSGTTLDEIFISLVGRYKVGNILLSPANFTTFGQARELCAAIRDLVVRMTGTRPLIIFSLETLATKICVDADRLPTAMAIAATGDPGNAFTVARMLATKLRSIGVDLLFTNALEVAPDHHGLSQGTRFFSNESGTTGSFGIQMLRGIASAPMLCGAMHFPGGEPERVDPYAGLATNGKTRDDLEQCELAPFRKAVSEGLDAMMMSHAAYPAFDSEPLGATCSENIVTSLLKNEMGFDGLVCSADLGAHAITNHIGSGRAAIMGVIAGVDLIYASSQFEEIAQGITHAAETGAWESDKRQRSLDRILAAKERCARQKPDDSLQSDYQHVNRAIMERAITGGHLPDGHVPPIGDAPLFIDFDSSDSDEPAFSDYMSRVLGGTGVHTSKNPDNEEVIRLLGLTRTHSSVVIATMDAHANEGQLSLANAMAGTGLPVVVFALGSPFDLSYLAPNIHSFAVMDDTEQAFDAVAGILLGRREATGTMPVHL